LRSKRSAILAFTLFLSLGIAADAQSTALTLSFTGSGIGTSLGFFLNGNGTLAPLGTARLSINGVPTGSTTSLAFAFLFPDGSTMAAAAAANPAPGTLTGTATISGGTGAFAGAMGSFTFSVAAPFGTSQTLPFTLNGSGALGQGAICAYVLDTGGEAFPAAGGAVEVVVPSVSDDNLRANAVAIRGDTVLRIDLIGLRVFERLFMDQVCEAHRVLGGGRGRAA